MSVLEETNRWFQVAVPAPDTKNIRAQFAAHVEEFNELLVEVHTNDHTLLTLINAAEKNLADVIKRLRSIEAEVALGFPNRVNALDAICDGLVTGTGLAHMLNMDVISGLEEVNRSNFSKFDDDGTPIFNESNKIIKGENYTPPDLTSFV